MRATFKLINAYFWKTFYGPIMAFGFPIVLLLVLGNIFRIEYVYPGLIALSFLFIGLLSLPLTIMELKQSSLFKYIGSSPVNPIKFTIVLIGFYVFVAVITAFIILSTTMIAFHKDVFPKDGFRNGILGGIFGSFKGAASFYVATFVHLIFVIVCGLLISTIAKTPQQALTTGLVIIIPSMFLSGMIISVDVIGQSKILNWVSRMIPFRYSTGNIVIASTPPTQIGDMFEQMSQDQMKLVFDNVNADGSVNFKQVNNPLGVITVHNMDELGAVVKDQGANIYSNGIMDKKLFQLTFEAALNQHANTADNNIFNWIDDWSVRRIPEVDNIKSFIQEYFGKFQSGSAGGTDWSKLRPFADQISQGQFGWLDIFMKQTNLLYTKADRVLNLMLPLSLSIGSVWYISSNFSWSAR